MENKKRTYIVVAVLVALVALGIGYAAVTDLLTISGTAKAAISDGIELEFTGTPTVTGNGQSGTTAAIDGTDSSLATCTVVLKKYGDSATCNYTVGVASTDTSLSASNLAVAITDSNGQAWTSSSSTYFDITAAVGQTTLAHNGTTTATVTVTLKKENTTNNEITETFTVKVTGDTVQN